ncbi:MAG: MFS transporter [Chlorobi bacterium]|nr:MFS transporter [Chlorobiota bacterium]
MTQTKTIRGYRWRILALLFVATTINYMDRSVIGVLAPTLQYKVFHWSDIDYSYINIAFKLAYAIGMLTMGGLIDRFGLKIGYTISIGLWSIFGMLHAAIRPAFSLIGFVFARFGLGFGESGNFPAAIKTVAEWFPKKERALATGIFNAGSNVGAILAPMIIPLIVLADGTNWQFAFLTTGLFSAIWVVLWIKYYHKPELHPRLSAEELTYINSDSVEETAEKLPWKRLLPVKQTWAFAIGKITDAVWWFYLFWGGKFLFDKFGLNIKHLALPLIIIYLTADLGSVGGGWMSSFLIKRGWVINKARKVTLLTCALVILPVTMVTMIPTTFKVDSQLYDKLSRTTFKERTVEIVDGKSKNVVVKKNFPAGAIEKLRQLDGRKYTSARDLSDDVGPLLGKEFSNLESSIHEAARSDKYYWIAVILMALAAAGHQAWSANLFTIVSDIFPKKATASVTGIGGMVGAVAGLLADFSLGRVLESSGPAGYFFAFLIAGSAYLIVLAIIHIIIPKMRPLDENLKPVEIIQ